MAEKALYRWFVIPSDAFTNDTISTATQALGLSTETTQIKIEGKKYPAWEVDYRLINYLWESKKSLPLKFKVLNKKGGGQIREWKFLFKRKKQNIPIPVKPK